MKVIVYRSNDCEIRVRNHSRKDQKKSLSLMQKENNTGHVLEIFFLLLIKLAIIEVMIDRS